MASRSIEQFRQYLENQKDDFLRDGRRVEGIIRDIFPEEKTLISLLTSAWKAGVVADLRQTVNFEVAIAQFSDRLCQEYGLKESAALTAVRVWAYALGATDLSPNTDISSTHTFIGQPSITTETKKCPYCAEEIKKDAKKCKYCHSDISDLAMDEMVQNKSTPLQNEFTNTLGMKFVLIPSGTFMMGSPANESNRDDREKQHPVVIRQPYYLQKTEVTRNYWNIVMNDSRSNSEEDDNTPVNSVSWYDVQDFIGKLNQMEGTDKYRLPTEAEWEYACRAGSEKTYCFGDDVVNLKEYAWYADNSGGKPHPVGQKKPNIWGLYDMHGNIWEWCQDWFDEYPSGVVIDPTGPTYCKYRSPSDPDGEGFRVIRGGGWNIKMSNRSASRNYLQPSTLSVNVGLRIAAYCHNDIQDGMKLS